jgi:hypothetical protein
LRKKAAVHHSKNCAMMSQMGRQAQPFGDVCSMSGLPPKADLNASSRHVAQVPIGDIDTLFDHLGGERGQRRGHVEAKRLGGL